MTIKPSLPQLEHDLDVFMLASKLCDSRTVLDYMYEGLFKLFPRHEMEKKLKEALKQNDWNNYIINQHIDNVSEIFLLEKIYFAKVEYSMQLKIDRTDDFLTTIMNDESIDSTQYELNKRKQAKFMTQYLAERYGIENVKYNTQADCFDVYIRSVALAVFEQGYKHWKFVRWMSGNVYKRIFSAGLVKKLATRFYLLD